MTISLVDVAKYYSGVSHQTQALERLQQQIEAADSTLLDDTSEFARLWRNQIVVQNDFLISSDGIGSAKVGSTYGQIQQALGEAYTYTDVSPFMVDLAAVAALRGDISGFSRGRAIAFYLTYPADQTLDDNTPIDLFITGNPRFKTAQGIGPGTLLSRAVRDYGEVTLSFNSEAESREFATFERGPDKLSFRAEALTHSFAGDYFVPDAQRDGSFNQTPAFFENASLSQVWVRA